MTMSRMFTMSKRGHSNVEKGSAQSETSLKQVKTKDEEDSVAIRSLDEFVASVSSLGGPELLIHLRRALNSPDFFTFGELLDLPNVAALRSSALEDEQRIFALLELFAFETFSQYQANKSAFGALLPVQERKLRQLSIVSLSARQKHISYSDLQEELGIFDMRELEDLLLDTMYQGLIEGKLDAKNELLRVDFAISRDVRDKDLADVVRVLEAWTVRSTNLLKEIGDRVNSARGALEQDAIDRRQFEDRVKETKEKLSKIFAKAGPGAGQADKGEARLGQGGRKRPGRRGDHWGRQDDSE